MPTATHTELTEYLRKYLTVTATMNGGRPDGARYSGVSDFLLDVGRPLQGSPLPAEISKGTPSQCFNNSHDLASWRHEMTYFEGYAIRGSLGVPILHAWCVDEAGQVIDRTWDDPQECVYWGVGFTMAFHVEHMVAVNYHGILGNHWMVKGCPLFNKGVVLDDDDHVCQYNED